MSLKVDEARRFFTAIYDKPVVVSDEHFELLSSRLATRMGGASAAGDAALQALMLNYILADGERSAQARDLSAILAGIKQRAVTEFTARFPEADLDTIVKAAKEAGYDVAVM
jgi:hypothetical protein